MIPAHLQERIEAHQLQVLGTHDRWAVLSREEPDPLYRYINAIQINPSVSGVLGAIGLNPSKATHEVDDNTFTKWQTYARLWGFGWLWMLNVYAIRGRDPKIIKRVAAPVGPANDDIVLRVAPKCCDKLVCSWGNHASYLARGARVKRELLAGGAELFCLGLNQDGSPEHALFLPLSRTPIPFGQQEAI
jgi:hypothetical protein